MAIQYSTTLRTNQLDRINPTLGVAGSVLKILTGSIPANCGTADTGTTLVSMSIGTTPFGSASSGTISKGVTWQASAVGSGTMGYFRVYDSAGGVCHIQGTCGQGSGDMSFDNTTVNSGQVVTVSSATITGGNA